MAKQIKTVCSVCGCNLETEAITGRIAYGQIVCSKACKLELVQNNIKDLQDQIQALKHVASDLENWIEQHGNSVYE